MKTKDIKPLLIFSVVVAIISTVYYVYLLVNFPKYTEKETVLGEVGEALGEVALWFFAIIYLRTLLKLLMGKGSIGQRMLPDFVYSPALPLYKRVLIFLNRTHVYVGIATVALVLLHILLLGLPMDIWFFPLVLLLVVWQGMFGLFLSWRYSPAQLKRAAYLVHAQMATGIMIGIFAFFGHLLVDA